MQTRENRYKDQITAGEWGALELRVGNLYMVFTTSLSNSLQKRRVKAPSAVKADNVYARETLNRKTRSEVGTRHGRGKKGYVYPSRSDKIFENENLFTKGKTKHAPLTCNPSLNWKLCRAGTDDW